MSAAEPTRTAAARRVARIAVALSALALCALGHAQDGGGEHSDAGGPFIGHTLIFEDGFRGVGVEYMGGDGRAHFWYRDESRVLLGRWRREGDRVCFSYPDYVFDYAPDIGPGEWFCATLDAYYERLISKRDGDVFSLRSGEIPFMLRTGEYFGTFDALFRAIGEGRR